MKRTTAAIMTMATLVLGLAALNPSPAACQTMVRDDLVKVRRYGPPVEIEVWVDKGEDAVYREGERLGVRFRASRDCYAVIYDIDTEGFLTLLYPDYPGRDGFVEGGRIYRLPHAGARYELLAEGPPGVEYIAAIACSVPLAYRLPWYLNETYETSGYRGYDDIDATVYDVGVVRGDPYVAMRDIAYDVLPEDIAEPDYDTAYTYFNVGGEYRHPRYLCYDCHGHVSWFDPYHDSCSLFEIRVDLDWRFVSHPTFYSIGPRFWYWNRFYGRGPYVGLPAFWCSVYPRHLFWDHYWDRLRVVGLKHSGKGHVYIPPRYRGKPAYWGGDRNFKPPAQNYRGGRGGGEPRVKDPPPGGDKRTYGGRGKPTSPVEIKEPTRLVSTKDARVVSAARARGETRERSKVEPRESTGAGERSSKAGVKSREKSGASQGESRIKIIRRRDTGGDKKAAEAKESRTSRTETKARSSKGKEEGGSKDDSKRSSARSRGGDSSGKTSAKTEKSRSGKESGGSEKGRSSDAKSSRSRGSR